MNMTRSLRTTMVVVALALGTFALLRGLIAQEGPDTTTLKGKPAPDFSLTTVDGKAVKLSDMKGNVVLVDFWATWCPPCRKSLPHIQEISANKDLADKGLKVLAIDAREGNDKIKAFLDQNKFTFTVPVDKQGTTMQAYLVQGIPTTVVVGRDGNIREAFVGFGPDTAEQIDKAVAAAVAEKM